MTHSERLKKISREYLELVCPYVLQYEILTNEFPTSILNEIRSAFTHFTKYFISESEETRESSLVKLENHFKRVLRDCYKYVCAAYDDEYLRFEEIFKSVDLSLIHDGEFLPKLVSTHEDAVKKLAIARKRELETDIKDVKEDELLKLYENAVIAYQTLYDIMSEGKMHAEKLQGKVILKDKKQKKKEKIYEVLTWVFGAATLAGLALTIVGFTL